MIKPDIERGLSWAEMIAADDRHGYSQESRLGPNYDCSSFVAFMLVIMGFIVDIHSTTWDLRKQLIDNGWTLVSGSRKRGDILLNEDHHVVTCLGPQTIIHASGKNKGILSEAYYEPSWGYQYHFRYEPLGLHEIALEVIAGKWGNYPERKRLLEAAGWNYDEVQRQVDLILHAEG